ncbi:unnamed protein product, partial [Trichogramma brassicae]
MAESVRFKGTRDKLMRWALLLQEFQFTLEHCPGRHNELPDHLSRNPCEETPEDLGDTERILPPTPKVVEEEEQGPCIGQAATVDLRDMIHDAQRNDPHPPDLNHERGYRKQGGTYLGETTERDPLEAVCADSHPPRASATVPRLSRSRTPGVGRDSPGTATPLLLARHAAGREEPYQGLHPGAEDHRHRTRYSQRVIHYLGVPALAKYIAELEKEVTRAQAAYSQEREKRLHAQQSLAHTQRALQTGRKE